MERGKRGLTILILVMFCLTIVIIAIGNQKWKEETKRLAQSSRYTDSIDNRIPDSGNGHVDSDLEDQKDAGDNGQTEETEETDETGNSGEQDTEETPSVAEQSGIRPISETMYSTTGLNVRSDATTDSERIGYYNVDDEVKVTGEVNNGWMRVDYNGKTGYVLASYLTSTEPTPPTQPSNPGGNNNGSGSTNNGNDNGSDTDDSSTGGNVNEGTTKYALTNLDLKESPDSESNTIGSIQVNQAVKVLEPSTGGWTKIQLDGKQGYVPSESLGNGQ